MTLTIKLDGNWSSFQLANSAPPLSVTDSAIAPSARIVLVWRRPLGARITRARLRLRCRGLSLGSKRRNRYAVCGRNRTFVALCPFGRGEKPSQTIPLWLARWSIAFVGTQGSRKNLGSHIDASLSRQPLVKGERLVRYEVNAVMSLKSAFLRGLASVRLHLRWHRRRDANLRHLVQIAPQTRKTHLWEDLYIWVGPDGL